MIKVFIFSVMVCSMIDKQCIPLPQASRAFDNYKECALYGYDFSSKFLREYDTDLLNEKQVYTTFVCKPTSTV